MFLIVLILLTTVKIELEVFLIYVFTEFPKKYYIISLLRL